MELCVKVSTNALKTFKIRSRDKIRHQAIIIPEPKKLQPPASRETPPPWIGHRRVEENLTFSFGSGSAQTFGPGTVPTEEILNEAGCPRISGGLGPGQHGLHVVLQTSLALLV